MTSVDTNYTFTGREDDGNGLMYYRNRYYSATMTRFISEDPIGLQGVLNQYIYIQGNPLIFNVPYGEYIWTLEQERACVGDYSGDNTCYGAEPVCYSGKYDFSPYVPPPSESNEAPGFCLLIPFCGRVEYQKHSKNNLNHYLKTSKRQDDIIKKYLDSKIGSYSYTLFFSNCQVFAEGQFYTIKNFLPYLPNEYYK